MDVVLGEDQMTVEADVENAARTLFEPGLDLKAPFDVCRQTGGTGAIVSDHAVLDDDLVHATSAVIIGERAAGAAR